MADVKIIDIDNEQWNMKDQNARDRILEVENLIPNTASTSNKLITQQDLKPALDFVEEEPVTINANMSNQTIDNKIYYYEKQKKLFFYMGGKTDSNYILATFSLPAGKNFNIGSWNMVFSIFARNQNTGGLIPATGLITKNNNVYSIYAYTPDANFNEFRALGSVIFEKP